MLNSNRDLINFFLYFSETSFFFLRGVFFWEKPPSQKFSKKRGKTFGRKKTKHSHTHKKRKIDNNSQQTISQKNPVFFGVGVPLIRKKLVFSFYLVKGKESFVSAPALCLQKKIFSQILE